MKRAILFTGCLAAVVLLAGVGCDRCSTCKTPAGDEKKGEAKSTESAPAKTLELTKADAGQVKAVVVDGKVTITLAGNATTGYGWVVSKISSSAVKQVGEVFYKTDKADPGIVGVGGQFTAEFSAVQAGQAIVEMEYKRPWEKDTPPLETFKVTIDVK